MVREVFEPDNLQQLAEAWLLHAKKFDEKHEAAARAFDVVNWWIGVPAAVLQPIVATSIVTSFIEGEGAPLWLKAGTIAVTLLSAGLVGLQTWGDFARRVERHRLARSRFKSIIQELELAMPELKKAVADGDGHALGACKRHLEAVRQRLAKARDEAPNVPARIDERVERAWRRARSTADLVPGPA